MRLSSILLIVQGGGGKVKLAWGFGRYGYGDEFVGLHLGLGDGAPLEARVHARFPSVSEGFSQVEGKELVQALEAADGLMYRKKGR